MRVTRTCSFRDNTTKPSLESLEHVVLGRSQRNWRLAILADNMMYIQESEFDIRTSEDQLSLPQTIKKNDSSK